MRPLPALLCAAGCALLVLLPATARAHLGGGPDSVETDRQTLRAQVRTTLLQNYDVHEIVADSTTVREYLTRGGTVFAVAWQGLTPPNLRQLLDTYFDRYQASVADLANRPDARRHVEVQAADLIVHAVVYPRFARGLACVPSLLPAGVALSDLQ